jgi:hypothetical protein
VVRRRKSKLKLVVLALLAGISGATYVMLRAAEEVKAPVLVPRDCNIGPTVLGIDVSYYQGDISWLHVKRSGVEFAFIRAYDGTDVFDTQFIANWTGAKKVGIRRVSVLPPRAVTGRSSGQGHRAPAEPRHGRVAAGDRRRDDRRAADADRRGTREDVGRSGA